MHRRFRALAITACAVASLALSGCATQKTWSYAPEPRIASEPSIDMAVAVPPFEDRRQNVNKNMLLMYMIPLMPYGWADFQTPEGIQMHVSSGLWQFRPTDDFARAVAQEIDNARIFRETFVSNRASEGDLVLIGEIRSTRYQGKMISYMLSVYGPLLWFIGFPAATTSNELEIHLRLVKTPMDPPLWEHTIRGELSDLSFLYVMRPDFRYDELLKNGLREAIQSLRVRAPAIENHLSSN